MRKVGEGRSKGGAMGMWREGGWEEKGPRGRAGKRRVRERSKREDIICM